MRSTSSFSPSLALSRMSVTSGQPVMLVWIPPCRFLSLPPFLTAFIRFVFPSPLLFAGRCCKRLLDLSLVCACWRANGSFLPDRRLSGCLLKVDHFSLSLVSFNPLVSSCRSAFPVSGPLTNAVWFPPPFPEMVSPLRHSPGLSVLCP